MGMSNAGEKFVRAYWRKKPGKARPRWTAWSADTGRFVRDVPDLPKGALDPDAPESRVEWSKMPPERLFLKRHLTKALGARVETGQVLLFKVD